MALADTKIHNKNYITKVVYVLLHNKRKAIVSIRRADSNRRERIDLKM